MNYDHVSHDPIPLSSPEIGEREEAAVLQVLRSGRLSLGPVLPEFEEAVARRVGSRYAVAVNSGTSGLHLAIKAAGVGPGDEVITTPFSFVASANCILFEHGVPRFVDIDPVSWNLDVSQIEAAITPRTRAILPVHVFGRPCDMAAILEIAERRGLRVIEDACEAIGASVGGRQAGAFGHTGVFAFYPNKQLTTGEGGLLVTDDAEAASLYRSWRNQGRGEQGAWLQHLRLGYNYRISDVNCAIGTIQIERLPEIMAAREQVARWYTATIRETIPEAIPPAPAPPDTTISWFVYVVRLRDDFTREDRDSVLRHLNGAGIGCNDYFSPIHLQPFYREMFHYGPGAFPVTEHVSERTIALPFFNRITEQQVEIVCAELRRAIAQVRDRSLIAVA